MRHRDKIMHEAISQLGQDQWVIEQTNNKRNGYFVEIGAHDGKTLSNTYLLEKEYGWSGICAECNPDVITDLIDNRNCSIETRAVMHKSDLKVPFYSHREDKTLSGVAPFGYIENDETGERKTAQYAIKTIDINTMLEEHNAPLDIDYISIDTEGTEMFVVSVFDFRKYNVKYWTIEVNGDQNAIDYLMRFFYYNGYESEVRDWDLFVWKHEEAQ